MFNQIWAIARKDLQIFIADKRAMITSFLVPIAIASFFAMINMGGASSTPASRIKVAFVDLDQSEVTKALLADLQKSATIEVVPLEAEQAYEAVRNGKYAVGIGFPKSFGELAKKSAFYGDRPEIDVFFDPSKSTDKQIAVGALMENAMGEVMKRAFSPSGNAGLFDQAIASAPNPQFAQSLKDIQAALKDLSQSSNQNDAVGVRQPFTLKETALTAEAADPDAGKRATVAHIFAGMAMQGVLFFGIECAMSLLRERKTGLWGRLRAAPIPLSGIVMGRGLGSFLIAMLIMAGVFLFGFLAMGVRVQGSWPGFVLILIMSSLMTACFGLFVASLGKTEAQSRGFSILAVLMMSMLGGAWFPASMMPGWVQTISLFVPVRWAVDGFDAILWRGQPISAALIPSLGLLGFSAVFAAIAILRLRKI